jgi:tetratricopeptide (TPR) repeat protein
LSAIRGYTEEVEKTYTHALTLSQQVGELPQRLPVLRSIASFYLYRGEFDKAATVGRELLELAERQEDVPFQVEGHTVVGSALGFIGDVPNGMDHLEQAIALFDPERGSRRFHLGPSAGVSASTTSALLLWLTGHPKRAVERASTALELARQMEHPFTLVYALFHVSFLDVWRDELQLALERATTTLELAEEHDYQVWRAIALIVQGMAMTGLGRPEEGLARTEKGVAAYQGLKTPPVFWPLLQYVRARAFALAGRPSEGLELIREAIAMVGEGILYPEFAVLNGDLLLAMRDPNAAERWYRSGTDAARKLRFRTSELRAAVRLAGLEAPDAIPMVRIAYDAFPDGSDTLDLTAAREILAGEQKP